MPTDNQRAKRIERAAEGALRWLGFLQQHSLHLEFVDQFDDQTDNDQPACICYNGHPYSWVKFVWRRSIVDHSDDGGLERMAIHEALHVLLFGPIESRLRAKLAPREWTLYTDNQERAVDMVTEFLDRRRPKYGYHPSGVPNTQKSAKEKAKRSER